MEKIAARAWKKHYGELSNASEKLLVDSGIHNYRKELRGLKKGTKEILKKNNATVSRNPITRGVATIRQVLSEKGTDNKTQSLAVNTIASAINPAGMTAPNFSNKESGIVNVKYRGKNHVRGIDKNIAIAKKISKKRGVSFPISKSKIEQMAKKRDRLTRFDRAFANAIIERHEADEVRAIRSKKNQLTPFGWSKGYAGHISKIVPYRESANVAMSPKRVQGYMKAFRSATNELSQYKADGLNYGKDVVLGKHLLKNV